MGLRHTVYTTNETNVVTPRMIVPTETKRTTFSPSGIVHSTSELIPNYTNRTLPSTPDP